MQHTALLPTRTGFSLSVHALVPFALLSLTALTTPAHAQQTFITTDTTLDSSNPIIGEAYVGENFNSTMHSSPTVNLVTGGSIGNTFRNDFLEAFNSSTVNIAGGKVQGIPGRVTTYDRSTVNMSAGSVEIIDAHNASTVNLSGGTLGGSVYAFDSSMVNVTGGTVGYDLHAENNSKVTISGSSFGQTQGVNLFVKDSAVLTLIGDNLSLTDRGADPINRGEDYLLFGTLADGTIVNGYVLNEEPGYAGSVNLIASTPPNSVPEPSALAFLLTGSIGAGLAFRRRK